MPLTRSWQTGYDARCRNNRQVHCQPGEEEAAEAALPPTPMASGYWKYRFSQVIGEPDRLTTTGISVIADTSATIRQHRPEAASAVASRRQTGPVSRQDAAGYGSRLPQLLGNRTEPPNPTWCRVP